MRQAVFPRAEGMADDAAMPLADADDNTLAHRYASGDDSAFAPLYARHKSGLWRYLLRQGCDDATAAELFQDIWARLVHRRASYPPGAVFAPWLYRVAHNRLVDHWRAQRPHEPLDTADAHPGPEHETPAARATQAEQGARLRQAIARLAPEQRQAFLLQAEGELSLDAIAAQQGVGRETVKSRLRYALAKLRGELADVWP